MKKYLIFIGLKIAEISTVVFIPYIVGSILICLTDTHAPSSLFELWLIGLFVIVFGSMFVAFGVCLISINLEWADRIINRKKR